jgi:hypothetical protein
LAVPPDKTLKHKQFLVDIYRENDHDATVHIRNMALHFKIYAAFQMIN